jgi:predicted Zn-dependent protease
VSACVKFAAAEINPLGNRLPLPISQRMIDDHRHEGLHRLNRRSLFPLLAGGALVLSGCSENNATGRKQLAFVSDAQLAQLSAAAWQDLLGKVPRSADANAQRNLEAIGRKIADASSQTNLDWEFVLFDSAEVNAFVLPGGKVGFYQGLVDLAGADGAVAAVMGHEVGHVMGRHAAERMSQQMAVQVGMQIAAAALSEEYGQYASDIAGALGMGVMYGVILPYSRKHEYEADRLGVELMDKAGFDPGDAAEFWQKMIQQGAGQAKLPAWASTHPADEDRLAALNAVISSLQES